MVKNIEKRREEILNLVNRYGSVSFQQIRQAFPDVSDVTLRKDLQYLDDNQQAIRTHGGMKSMPSALNYYYRSNINHEVKKIIAAKATALIRPGDSLFISAGTTCAELARVLPVFPLKVVSNGIYTVNNIAALPNISVELLGGDVDLNIMRTEGISTLDQLRSRHFTTAFLGTIGLNLDYGFAHNNAIITAILERVSQRADRTIVLADSSKITDKFSPHTLPVSTAQTIVTDDRFPEEVVEALRAKGLEVI